MPGGAVSYTVILKISVTFTGADSGTTSPEGSAVYHQEAVFWFYILHTGKITGL